MYDFLTIGTATRDIFLSVTDGRILNSPPGFGTGEKYLGFEYGSKIVSEEAFFTFGGGAFNASTNLSRMGFKAAVCFRIGREATGDSLMGELEESGIACRYVERDDTRHTGMSFIINVPHADHVLFHHPGAASALSLKGLAGIETRAIYLTSIYGDDGTLLTAIAAKAQSPDVKFFFNPGDTQIDSGYRALSGAIKQAHVLMVNRPEACDLVRSCVGGPDGEIPDLLRTMSGWGPDICVITDGRAGSFAYDGSDVYYHPSFPAETLDTTGAGDSFGSAFAAGLELGNGDLAGALRLASANAASVVSRMGSTAGALTLDEAEALAARYPDITAEILR